MRVPSSPCSGEPALGWLLEAANREAARLVEAIHEQRRRREEALALAESRCAAAAAAARHGRVILTVAAALAAEGDAHRAEIAELSRRADEQAGEIVARARGQAALLRAAIVWACEPAGPPERAAAGPG